MIAIVSAFYAQEQASIGREQFERETKLERQRALASGVDLLARVETVLGDCLASNPPRIEACGIPLSELRDEAELAAGAPALATDYPLIHLDLSALRAAVTDGKVAEAIRLVARLQRSLQALADDIDPYDGATHLRLALHANVLQAHAELLARFASDRDPGAPMGPSVSGRAGNDVLSP